MFARGPRQGFGGAALSGFFQRAARGGGQRLTGGGVWSGGIGHVPSLTTAASARQDARGLEPPPRRVQGEA